MDPTILADGLESLADVFFRMVEDKVDTSTWSSFAISLAFSSACSMDIVGFTGTHAQHTGGVVGAAVAATGAGVVGVVVVVVGVVVVGVGMVVVGVVVLLLVVVVDVVVVLVEVVDVVVSIHVLLSSTSNPESMSTG